MALKKKTAKTVKKKPAKRKTPVKKKVARESTRPVGAPPTQERVEASKYYAGPVMQKFVEERPFEFPAGYGDNRAVLMVRDPHWIHAYWEVNENRCREIRQEIGDEAYSRARLFLRVYDTHSGKHHDIEVGGARNWYIRVPAPNRTYFVEIGFLTADGRFLAAARSNAVTTPLDTMSDVIDEQWMIPDWDKLYALSGGFGVGRSSGEIKELMKKRFQQESASGWLFSPSSPVRKMGQRPFWLVANCELIVYGATEPSATVTVQGRKIDLREDGTFSQRFALPDGHQIIPIEATRDDGAERRRITPRVERKTE
ncbi:hypothetical protein A2625_02455 [candidate division WOR-1 bacterium RIFCSPHIGHO2_01_FULL_53_15]|uniref:DUF4912 domain-containing protein n=1 Tax=candidate division WOR-1 bacterium RIFCSPHIGHO2_01_FULL_53_15 TaxID=1802564 RepID=A0A1F4PZS4_UNCSA|nr:MAG: hypothetical protein A2625_02455 [candidate division WOR-1 bacterium RIFCSPHIGHO2_01_FULL_53_15]OGC10826.1 MAG: hypothetical protein A3D23_05535 [candidate division WOR-1 bacterium RIFCSPHIGHO2_02_FULL_53_26]